MRIDLQMFSNALWQLSQRIILIPVESLTRNLSHPISVVIHLSNLLQNGSIETIASVLLSQFPFDIHKSLRLAANCK